MSSLTTYGLYLSIFLLSSGLVIAIIKQNTIGVLIGMELILNAANLNLVIFSSHDPSMQGQIMGLFVVVVAAAEAATALAILLLLYKRYHSSNIKDFNHLKY
jgi:NADH:ubiquinone oxidoreductase subunit K